jgi:hypothetical protein
MHREVLKLPAGLPWAEDLSSGGVASGECKLGFEFNLCKKQILVGYFYRDFLPTTRDGRGLKFNVLSVLIRSGSSQR